MHSPEGIHKDTQASCGDAHIARHPASHIHGRYATDGRLQLEANGACTADSVPPRELGVHSQRQKNPS